MAFLVAVANLKGGCGKSCIAVNLACSLAVGRTTAVLVDADTQATASYYCESGTLPVQCEVAPLDEPKHIDRWIRRVLAIEADYVVLDAPPHVGMVTRAVVGIADLLLVPCTPSTADLIATAPAIELIREARAQRVDGGPMCLLIPSRVDIRTNSGREIEAALKQFGEPVGPVVHQRAAFVDAFTVGRWIGEYAPGSGAHQDIEAVASKVRKSNHHGKAKKT